MLQLKLKAHALYFAILIGVLVSLLLISVFLVNHFYSQQYVLVDLKRRNYHNLKSVEVLAKTSDNNTYNGVLFDDDLNQVSYVKSTWGSFDIINCRSIIKKDTLTSHYLCGAQITDQLALSIKDYDHALRVSGSSKVIGDAALPLSLIHI